MRVYGEAKGRFGLGVQAARSNLWLEAVAQHVADEFVWPVPFTLEMQSCGFPNARWDLSTGKLTLCYELAADFEELYRSYGAAFMPASLMIGHHFSISAFWRAASASGVCCSRG
jgi:Putative metallopeptidase